MLDKRTVRFHTGKGLEGILPDIICKRIEEQDMVPLFKEGKNDEAMTAGVDHVVKVLTDPIYAEEILAKELRNYSGWVSFFPMTLGFGLLTLLVIFLVNKNKFTDSKKPLSTPYGEMRMSRMGWLTEFGIVPVAILLVFQFSPMINPILECLAALYGYFIFTLIVKRVRMRGVVKRLIEKEKYKKVFDFFEEYRAGWLVYGILFPIPLLPHYFMYRNRMVFYRNHPRACEKCGKPARKLDEQTEDKYLSKEKAFEEGLKSADYDVWLCDACGTYFELVYQNRFSKFSPCPKCKTKAWYQKSNRTIDSPTESSSGKGERTFECKFCNHSLSTTYTIARLSSSSSSSSSGGSSGGSFGGGSSGGGGASSSW